MGMAGLAFFGSAILEIAIKSKPESQQWVVMIALAIGLTFMLVGFIYARRAGDKEKLEAEKKEKERDEAAQKSRDLDREERAKEREEDKSERQREREEEQKRRNLEAAYAKERADKEKTERDKAEEADRVRVDQQELSDIQHLQGCPQTDAYRSFVQARRMCGNCKLMIPRGRFHRNDLVDRFNWLTCLCYNCAVKLWPNGKHERVWLDDYTLQVKRS
jgi:hypothetical protein